MANPLASLVDGGSIFAGSAKLKLEQLRDELAPLAARYDVVVANPPYMGGKNMNRWLGDWVKRSYPDVKGDLFSCFVVRNVTLGAEHAQLGFMTPYVWMFIGTYEKLRRFMIEECTITSLIQLEYSGFAGATVPICTFTLQKGCQQGYRGGYIRLSDFPGADNQAPKVLEALSDPGCGWFYRRDTLAFEAIPGHPIAYWMPKSVVTSFNEGISIDELSDFTGSQNITGDNNRFLRFWWEVDASSVGVDGQWIPYAKGGDYRRWYGNIDHIVDCRDEAIRFYRDNSTSNLLNERYWYQEGITYNAITSGRPHFRHLPSGCAFDKGGPSIVRLGKYRLATLGFLNSTTCELYLSAMNPTLNLQVKDIKTLPVLVRQIEISSLDEIVNRCILLSNMDWQLRETAEHGFVGNPLL